jgi:hypothetical protein
MDARKDVDPMKLAILVVAVGLFAAVLALAIDFSDAMLRASTPVLVAFAGAAGVAAGALVARTFRGAAAAGAIGGFVNAFAGVGMAMFVREFDVVALLGASLGGALLGAITGVLGHLLVIVVKKRGQPLQR